MLDVHSRVVLALTWILVPKELTSSKGSPYTAGNSHRASTWRGTSASTARQLEDNGSRQRGPTSKCWRCRYWRRLQAFRYDPRSILFTGRWGKRVEPSRKRKERREYDAVEWARWSLAPGARSSPRLLPGVWGGVPLHRRRVPSPS